ncbi:fluoride efflux transporter CrcB [Glycomyces tenuis]|uniref:fluoride efflux transporter CrcB n=1 Tax=Glycomyces tenuis TaxID=58116 RepID=UPI00040D1FA9|nr:fluoride efflux transporter CrcB [Glycomyces tenuis]
MTVLLVAVGAAVGAPLRYLVDRAVQSRHDSLFPWGTFCANTTGSFILGALAGAALAGASSDPVTALLGTGLCGALTTYSTFGYETVRLIGERARLIAVLNAAASVAGGLGAALVGHTLAQAVIA